jgi:hypothetical protein
MLMRRAFAGFVAAAALGALACNGGGTKAKTANVTPADMPEGADWTGVYFDQLYGYFHIVQEGKTVSGKWERPAKDKWGELHGEATGNVLKFTWSEYTVGAVGPAAQRDGKGYFVYSRPSGENVDDKIDGEIGRGQDEVGEKLSGVKQRLKMPDLGSIGGTGATDIGGGDWDGEKKEGGTPEPPSPPPPP